MGDAGGPWWCGAVVGLICKKGAGLSPGRLSSNKETLPVVKGRLRGVRWERRAGDGGRSCCSPRCRPAEQRGWKMNLEKYKKFLDGLGTLRGICDPWQGEAEQMGATICHGSLMEADPSQEELLASPAGLVLPRLRSTSLFCPLLGFGAGHKGALGQRLAQPCQQCREAAWQITTGKRFELKFLLRGRAGCCSHGMGADPALPRVRSLRCAVAPGCRSLFSRFPSF